MKYDKLNQGIDYMEEPVEIELLMHHVGTFTDYFVRDASIRDTLLLQLIDRYSPATVANIKKAYATILKNPNAKIIVVFDSPDSICFPYENNYCKKCLERKEYRLGGHEKDESYRTFMKAGNSVWEAQNILFYEGLLPGEFQEQPDFMESISGFIKKTKDLYDSGELSEDTGYAPHHLDYQPNFKDIIDWHFPKVANFRKTEIYDLFINTRIGKITCGIEPSKEKIERAMKKYSDIISGNPKKIYEAILESI